MNLNQIFGKINLHCEDELIWSYFHCLLILSFAEDRLNT